MLDLDYIKENTLWVIKYSSGHREVVKGSELDKYYKNENEDIKDVDTLNWKGQPDDLKEFWKSYTHAIYYMDRRDLFYIDDFYNEWVKDPNQFKEDHLPVISYLSQELDNLRRLNEQSKLNIQIVNYDKHGIGNHYLAAWDYALKIIDKEFDVVACQIDGIDVKLTIQCDDEDLLDQLSILSNHAAFESSPYGT